MGAANRCGLYNPEAGPMPSGLVLLTCFLKEKTMTHLNLGRINFGPLVPSTVGFDRYFDAFEALEKVVTTTYPPHNIVKEDDNNYIVELAVAGFKEDEIEIEIVKNELVIRGNKTAEDARSFLHRGIATRSFKKIVHLVDTIKVKGARLDNGILSVELENVIPKEDIPKRIPISTVSKKKELLQE
jgi:molecular chaperone IbpA